MRKCYLCLSNSCSHVKLVNSSAINGIHSHKTHEERQKCWANFGKCWTHPTQTDKTKQLINQKPSGTGSRDHSNGGIN